MRSDQGFALLFKNKRRARNDGWDIHAFIGNVNGGLGICGFALRCIVLVYMSGQVDSGMYIKAFHFDITTINQNPKSN